MKNIVIIQGHPDPSGGRLCNALADAYAAGAVDAGHDVYRIELGQLEFPYLRSHSEWTRGKSGTPLALVDAQTQCIAADHLVLIYPLWMGTMPAILKSFIEQVFRPGVALAYDDDHPRPLFKGKSARVVVTMGMPALAYRWYFGAHSLKSLERNILKFSGIRPVRESLFGMVDKASQQKRARWITKMRELGSTAK